MSNIDYILQFAKGQLDKSHTIYRATVSDGKKTIPKIGEVKIKPGFGSTIEKATADFISRNDSNLIDKIFDVEDV